ncbi:unnamed protein product [Microthlaspi erraticum]|uniref:CCHC-type domain-containing protein n=1 Tax=Microthlaspi erraticum TaxID=1685480 RepID=A0A6D2IFH4_9BRAS|nr:unnamed protein product [Microthlaspi erraticum]CAA7053175.1 unnamed protein product [Microthlaspi erraticum]
MRSQNRKRKYDGDTQGEPNHQAKRRENRGALTNTPRHIAQECPSKNRYRQPVPPHIVCHSCGEKGYYSNFCLKLQLNQIIAFEEPPPRPEAEAPARPAIKAPTPSPRRLKKTTFGTFEMINKTAGRTVGQSGPDDGVRRTVRNAGCSPWDDLGRTPIPPCIKNDKC